MRRLIAITLSLLCIALPMRAGADAVALSKHCSRMQAHISAEAHADASPQAHADMTGIAADPSTPDGTASKDMDCCNDAATVAATGQLCKIGQECSPPVAYLLAPTLLRVAIATQPAASTTLFIPLHTRPPGAVWRPPA